jgi:hypothetical protein
MRWSDLADWIGPTPNEDIGGMSTVLGVVMHIQQGTEQGTEVWVKNPASQVSAHFLSPKTGRAKQVVDTADKAWAEVAGNSHWLSIENEGLSGQLLTPSQLEFNAQILARAHKTYGVPLAVSDDPNVPGLGHHSMGGVAWGNHPNCPGVPIINQKPDIVRRAAEIVNEVDDMFSDADRNDLRRVLELVSLGLLANQNITASKDPVTGADMPAARNGLKAQLDNIQAAVTPASK